MNDRRPMRILQVVTRMIRGGTQTWLMHVLRHIDRRRFQMDFLVPTSDPCDYDDEIRALGSRIYSCLPPRRPLWYADFFQRRLKGRYAVPDRSAEYALFYGRFLRKCLRQHGPYDVVHGQMDYFNGFVLRQAAKEGVEARIAHSHNDRRVVDAQPSLPRRAYLKLMKRWIDRYATERLACSDQAGLSLFDGEGGSRPPWRMLPCGVDLEPFQQPVDRTAVRAALGIPAESRVIGHVGRFAEQKNHRFLIEVMAEVARRDPKAYLLLVGEGPLRMEVEQDVARRSLQGRVVFAGVRPDVPRLMLGAMDAFVFPSHYEGLPLVGVEAQAAGLPCLFADTFSTETDLVSGLVQRLSLGDLSTWVGAIQEAIEKPRKVDGDEALAIVRNSPFNIRNAVQALERVYEGSLAVRV